METTDLVPSCNSKLIIIQQGFAFSASLVLCFVMCDKYDRDYCSRPLNSIRVLKRKKKKKGQIHLYKKNKAGKEFFIQMQSLL